MATVDLPDKLEQALQDHYKATKAINDSVVGELVATPIPHLIYHYTDDRGLKGVLETGRFWFTDVFSLNDPSELKHGVERAFEILKSQINTGSPWAQGFCEIFEQMMAGTIETMAHLFVFCFSKTDQDLGQWRAYADDGHGYAIGFDTSVLEDAFVVGAGDDMRNAFPVSYKDEDLSRIHEQLVEKTIPTISASIEMGLGNPEISRFMDKLAAQLVLACCSVSVYFKHKAYKNEEEYRFLQASDFRRPVKHLRFLSRRYSLIRYIEFDWRNVAADSIKEIVLGPAGDPMIGTKFANDCLRKYMPDAEGIDVRQSNIPYRSVRS